MTYDTSKINEHFRGENQRKFCLSMCYISYYMQTNM